MTSKQRKREARKQPKLEAAKPAPPAFFGLFDPRLTQDDPEFGVFCEATGILQQLEQLQHQHRESDLLDLLHGCLHGPALDWFKDQPEFTSLHDFDIALTKAFPPKSSAPQEQQKSEVSTPDRCQWCQLDYEIWNSHRLQYSSCAAQNQQAYEFALQFLEEHACETFETSTVSTLVAPPTPSAPQEQQELNISPEDLKAIKKTKANVIKNAKRVKSKALKAQEAAKSTSELQDIDIFDSILTYENRRFSEAANFLQHLQQCQHQYKKSDLLFLLPSCLWGPAFDIWYDKQNVMNSASLNEWIEALRAEFADAAFAKSKVNCSKITCMRCESSFNSKEKLREHVREQHAKKFICSSSLSINTLKSVCEDEEKPVFDDSSASPTPQESEISTATPKQISESTMIFEVVTSSKSFHLPSNAPEIVPKPMENMSTQCSITPSKPLSSQMFESESQEASVQKSSIIDAPLSNDTAKSVCETEERSAVIEASALQAPHIPSTTPRSQVAFETTSPKSSSLPTEALKVVSESVENESNQCPSASVFSFPRTLEPEHHEFAIKKPESESSLLEISPTKSVCESEENAAVTCSSASLTSQKSSILSSAFKRSCLICRIDVPSVKEHYLESPSCHEALRHRIEQQLARRALQQEQQEAQKQADVEKAISQLVKDSHLSINSVNLVCEIEETPPASHKSESTKRSATCRRCNQIFNSNNKLHEHIREHHARKSVKSSNLRVIIPESSYKSIEKSAVSCPLTPQSASPTPPATPRNQIFSAEMPSRSDSPKGSHLPIATLKITPKSVEKLPANCPLTPPLSPPRTPVRKHQELHMQKSYLTMDDLSRMFGEKPRPFGLQQHQNRALSPRSSGIRQAHSVKSHLTIENLFEMFNGKCRRKGLFQGQRNVSSREFSSGQSRITAYFKPTANQKPSINQDSKSSEPKSWNQHMLRNQSALPPAKACLRNRPIYHTNCQMSPASETGLCKS